MVAHRRRRELFPPDRRLQARMAVAAVATPLLVLAALAAVLMVLPFRLGGPVGGALVLGVIGAITTWRAGELRGHVLGPSEHPELQAAVARLCLMGDLPRPEIVLEPERQPNSWMVAPPRRTPRLHVTRGLLEVLSGPELEAVVAHELAHLANRDALVMTVVGGPSSALLEGSRAVSGVYWGGVFVGGWIARALGELGGLGTSALSRYRELSADAGAAALTGHPAALASALVKLSGGLDRVPRADLRAVAGRDAFHLLPVGEDERFLGALRATHPSLERRLAALERLERRMATARPAPPADLGD
jgi:heat shock protein HtpX